MKVLHFCVAIPHEDGSPRLFGKFPSLAIAEGYVRAWSDRFPSMYVAPVYSSGDLEEYLCEREEAR